MEPYGWTDEDYRLAGMQMAQFLDTKAYEWLANFIGTRQRWAESSLVAGQPHMVAHGKFIEEASRHQAYDSVLSAITFIVSKKEKKP